MEKEFCHYNQIIWLSFFFLGIPRQYNRRLKLVAADEAEKRRIHSKVLRVRGLRCQRQLYEVFTEREWVLALVWGRWENPEKSFENQRKKPGMLRPKSFLLAFLMNLLFCFTLKSQINEIKSFLNSCIYRISFFWKSQGLQYLVENVKSRRYTKSEHSTTVGSKKYCRECPFTGSLRIFNEFIVGFEEASLEACRSNFFSVFIPD